MSNCIPSVNSSSSEGVFDSSTETELILRSPALPIRVAAPQSVQEDRDAMDLFSDEVGTYIALGGNRNLQAAHEALEAFVQRREGEAGIVTDPVAAAVVRAQALDAQRSYVRFQDGKYRQLEADEGRAAQLLERLGEPSLEAFDAVTAKQTRDLMEAYEVR